jgi:hypothetical protein
MMRAGSLNSTSASRAASTGFSAPEACLKRENLAPRPSLHHITGKGRQKAGRLKEMLAHG